MLYDLDLYKPAVQGVNTLKTHKGKLNLFITSHYVH